MYDTAVKSGDLIAGRFRLDERIGTGGMGVVFHALDETSQRPVAIKILDGRSVLDIERARREAQALARLADPAIVGHVDDGVTETGQIYLAMEWIHGVTAGERISQDGFSLREAVALAKRVAGALASAHGAGVLHRDIKPSNVLLPDNDPARAMLIDFGIARITDTISSLTRTGHAVGTPGYMAPEQARGERTITPAADVFGLGCLLYECASGQPAFSGTAPVAVIVKILMAEPTPIAEHCPEISDELRGLIDRIICKDPARRIPDGATLVRELAALGDIADGPRRSAQHLATATRNITAITADTAHADSLHCLVMASLGRPDDPHEPPSASELAGLRELARSHDATLDLLATGGLIAHLSGPPATVIRRAAQLAFAMRKLLPRWSIALTSGPVSITKVADTASALLAGGAMADLFGKSPHGSIVVDPDIATLLADEYDVKIGRGEVRLVLR